MVYRETVRRISLFHCVFVWRPALFAKWQHPFLRLHIGFICFWHAISAALSSEPLIPLLLEAIPHPSLFSSPFFFSFFLLFLLPSPCPSPPSLLSPFVPSLGVWGRATYWLSPQLTGAGVSPREIFECFDAVCCDSVNNWLHTCGTLTR